jgi:hypothetical protein
MEGIRKPVMNTAIYPHSPVKDSLEKGLSFQDFVCIELAKRHIVLQNIGSKRFQLEVGENLQGFEIKLDNGCTKFGHLSIEVAEKASRDRLWWTPSGIMRNDNSILYIQGNYEAFWVFAKNWLRRWKDEKCPEVDEFNGTIQRFFLDIEVADVCAIWKWSKDPTDG